MPKFTNIDKAKSQLLLHHCFFASLLLRMPVSEDTTGTIPTMGTNGKEILYNPAFVDSLTVPELITVLCHEIYHVIFEHMLRRGKRDMTKWNIATDYAINLLLSDARMPLPKDILLDARYKDMYAEKIYDQLPSIKTLKLPANWNIGAVDDMKDKDGRDLTQDEIDEISKEVKANVKEAALIAKMAGKLPGDIERLLGDLLNPKIPWREVLAKFLTVHVLTDYTWRLPNKRFVSHGIYLPALSEPEIGDLVFVVDTSGSITEQDLVDLMSEVSGILMAFPSKSFWLLGCDTKVASAQELNFSEPIQKPKGGGGTCYKEPFKWVEKQGLDPACLIYLTDGECDTFPSTIPDYPVLWVLTQDTSYYKHVWEKPPFGDVITMDDRASGRGRKRY